MKNWYKVLILLGVVLLIIVIYSFPCIQFKLSKIHQNMAEIEKYNEIIILYGTPPCSSCPVGQLLLELAPKKELLILVSGIYSDISIDNLIEQFSLAGKVMPGDDETEYFIKKLSACKKLKKTNFNCYLKREKDKLVVKSLF